MLSLTSISLLLSTMATAQQLTSYCNVTGGNGDNNLAPDGKYTIWSEGIRMSFVPYGASISNLFINDSRGIERDVVYGFDEAWMYTTGQHGYWGAVPGRYANRIVNSTFTIDGVPSHIIPNENNSTDTLHGGPDGWSYRNFSVVAHTDSSITFSMTDPAGDQGFPGEVVAFITYTAAPYEWRERMVAIPTTEKTPIMLSSHVYWNLDGYANDQTDTALNHTLYMPYAGMRTNVTTTQVPTGTLDTNWADGPFDFWTQPRQVGYAFDQPELNRSCGPTCLGYNVCFLTQRQEAEKEAWEQTGAQVATLRSAWSGIQLDVFTDQDALQIYSCNNQNGSVPLKATQGTPTNSMLQHWGCVVIEVEDWIAGINYPEWKREEEQIFGPGTQPYVLEATYRFSINQTAVDD